MTGERKQTPDQYLAQHGPEAAEAFQSLRKAVLHSGPPDHRTCELTTLGHWRPPATRSRSKFTPSVS